MPSQAQQNAFTAHKSKQKTSLSDIFVDRICVGSFDLSVRMLRYFVIVFMHPLYGKDLKACESFIIGTGQ